tara:strand:- start:165 stop:416 length:252 start_codon:yes stop_codon:yes gene_type:complete
MTTKNNEKMEEVIIKAEVPYYVADVYRKLCGIIQEHGGKDAEMTLDNFKTLVVVTGLEALLKDYNESTKSDNDSLRFLRSRGV